VAKADWIDFTFRSLNGVGRVSTEFQNISAETERGCGKAQPQQCKWIPVH
jgi:hypothetical protein